MANYSRWTDAKDKRPAHPRPRPAPASSMSSPSASSSTALRTDAGLSQRELAERMGTTQSVISRLQEGGARNRIDTLARVATALDRHLVVSFPEKVHARLKDGVRAT